MGTAIILNASQVAILQALAKHDRSGTGMTAVEIESMCPPGTSVSHANLGVARNGPVEGSLYKLGFINAEQHDIEGKMALLYRITYKGRKAAETYKTRAKTSHNIDPRVLDPVVIKFRATRTYGIDTYTDDDLREIKALVGKHADGLSLDELRQQIANRRKQGAYADPRSRIKRAAKSALQAFGPEGWACPGLLSTQLVQILYRVSQTGLMASDEK